MGAGKKQEGGEEEEEEEGMRGLEAAVSASPADPRGQACQQVLWLVGIEIDLCLNIK